MGTPILMPSLGMYTAEGTVVNWLQPHGAAVRRGEPVVEIETEKAVNQVISPAEGILHHVAEIGALVKEEGLLGNVLAQGEALPLVCDVFPSVTVSKPPQPAEPHHEIAPCVEERIKASPAARRMAREHNLSLAQLAGSGPGGRIVEADVAAALGPAARGVDGNESNCDNRPVALAAMRRTIVERLRESLDRAVPVTITQQVEAGGLLDARKALGEKLKLSVPFDALFLKLLAGALRSNPELNAVIAQDQVRTFETVDICFAVAVPGGLVAPVVREVDRTGLAELVGRMKDLSQRARSNTLLPEHLSGGSATVTNLGACGVDVFTPILNPPQATILGVGRVAERAVARHGALALVPTCWLSLTFDHRVTDGVPAARFLAAIAKNMKDSEYLCNLI